MLLIPVQPGVSLALFMLALLPLMVALAVLRSPLWNSRLVFGAIVSATPDRKPGWWNLEVALPPDAGEQHDPAAVAHFAADWQRGAAEEAVLADLRVHESQLPAGADLAATPTTPLVVPLLWLQHRTDPGLLTALGTVAGGVKGIAQAVSLPFQVTREVQPGRLRLVPPHVWQPVDGD